VLVVILVVLEIGEGLSHAHGWRGRIAGIRLSSTCLRLDSFNDATSFGELLVFVFL
jgi:hypothetical protein